VGPEIRLPRCTEITLMPRHAGLDKQAVIDPRSHPALSDDLEALIEYYRANL